MVTESSKINAFSLVNYTEEGVWKEEPPKPAGRIMCLSLTNADRDPMTGEATRPDAGKESGKEKK
jgi:hypothetical protein